MNCSRDLKAALQRKLKLAATDFLKTLYQTPNEFAGPAVGRFGTEGGRSPTEVPNWFLTKHQTTSRTLPMKYPPIGFRTVWLMPERSHGGKIDVMENQVKAHL